MNIFNSHKIENHLQNHPKGQIYPVLTIGWPMLSGFVVEDWKLDFCDSSSVKLDFSLIYSMGSTTLVLATWYFKANLDLKEPFQCYEWTKVNPKQYYAGSEKCCIRWNQNVHNGLRIHLDKITISIISKA